MAREVWRLLFGAIEERWQTRFGKEAFGHLREKLLAVIALIPSEFPDCLPILGYGLFSSGQGQVRRTPAGLVDRAGATARLSLPALLSRVLLAFAIAFESESSLSLAISANVLRVLDNEGVRVRALPLLTGVSKESIRMAMGILGKRQAAIGPLRRALERLAGGATRQTAPLFLGLEPYPDGWRASLRKPNTLPHYPMVTHRGGFPDGS